MNKVWVLCGCVNEWATNEYNGHVYTLLISMLICDRYRSMSIDGVNGSGLLVFVGKNE